MKYSPSSKELRQYGIDDLKNYIAKLKKNIKVFEEAIAKEKKEIKRAQGMIKALKQDQQVPAEVRYNLDRS